MTEEHIRKKPIKDYKRTWKKTPTVYQMEATECGAASLGMILGYYNCFVPLEELRVKCGVSRDGCNASNIIIAAKELGLNADAYSCNINDLLKNKNPCIIHWDFNHFVVFEGIKGNYAYINDPASGRKRITREELNRSFTGIVILFSKTDKLKVQKKHSSVIEFLATRAKNQKSTLVALFIIGLLLVLPGIVAATFSKIFIDTILPSASMDWAITLLLFIAFTMVVQFVLTIQRAALVNKFQMKLSLVYGYKFLLKMLQMPITFYEQRFAGDLSQRVMNNDKANAFLSGRLVLICLDILTAIFYLFFMIFYNWFLTLISLIGVAFCLFLWSRFSEAIKDYSVRIAQENGKLMGTLFSGLQISRTLKASGIENNYTRKIFGTYTNMANAEQKAGQLSEVLNSVPACITQIINITILMIGAVFVIDGNMTMGMLSAFAALFTSFSGPINALFAEFQEIQNLNADLCRVEDIEKQSVDERFTKKTISTSEVDQKIIGKINVNNLSFGYNKLYKPTINNISFSAEPGDIIAFVGPSGCGKSTILKVISGLCKPWSGQINFDDKNSQDYSTNVLTGSVSAINQDVTLFSGTISENLNMWNDYIMNDQLLAATKDACIHEHITTLEDGYQHQLREDGSNLSGGQRQCLEIARALVSNPSILIMDEATSALDPVTEQKVMDNIKRRGCTCLIVAHRLSTIRDANQIIYIEDGKIVETGTHNDLIKKDSKYKKLVQNI